ncbi:MAG: TIGR03560 family F420-dependent LLM class oxidoreductase [Acidimicrobiales bacterium]
MIRLPDPCLVVLVGASGAGKSTWAAEQLPGDCVLSSDALRAMVGTGVHDQRAGTDAFDVLDLLVERRTRRRLTSVIDTTGVDATRRTRWQAVARRHGLPAHVVVFRPPDKVVRERNRARSRPVPSKALTAQLRAVAALDDVLDDEGWDGVHHPAAVALVPPSFLTSPAAARRQLEDPMPLEFGVQVPRFDGPGGSAEAAQQLSDLAVAAEDAGFTSLWVMDHFLQIPVVGREWEDMLESYTTLGFLAGRTSRIRLGTLVTGVTYRNLAHLAKIVATLDVLSGGRAWCGLGAAWFRREHDLYGWDFPPLARRFELLEDALELLPLMWGSGSPRFEGRTTIVPEAICYPRPLQDRLPILVGGSGEKRTLRLVAQHADACNLFGDPATVRHKVDVLHRHCDDVRRDPATIRVTHLSTAGLVEPGEQRGWPDVGSVDEQVGRYRELAEAGVQTAIVSLRDPVRLDRWADVVRAFMPRQ